MHSFCFDVANVEVAIKELLAASHRSLEKEGKHIGAALQQIERVMPFSTPYTANLYDIIPTISLSILR